MQKLTKKYIFLQFISSLLLSIAGFVVVLFIYKILIQLNINIGFGGDKGEILLGLLIGLPMGTVLGIFLLDKIYYKIARVNITGICLSIIFIIIGESLGLILLDKIGGGLLIFFPIIISLFGVVGYNCSSFFKKGG